MLYANLIQALLLTFPKSAPNNRINLFCNGLRSILDMSYYRLPASPALFNEVQFIITHWHQYLAVVKAVSLLVQNAQNALSHDCPLIRQKCF